LMLAWKPITTIEGLPIPSSGDQFVLYTQNNLTRIPRALSESASSNIGVTQKRKLSSQAISRSWSTSASHAP